jgi:H+/gluconate symporter-like permease
MNKKRLHTLTIVMGVITALVMVCSQLFFFEVAKYTKKDVKTEKHEQQHEEDESYISLPSFSQPTSSAHVSLSHKPFCLFEILFENNKEEVDTHTIPLSLGKFLQTLFRVTISPNAP